MLMHLASLGRCSWPQLQELVGQQECAWADLDGFQIGAIPDTPPPSTHLWSWSATRWVRVRVDGTTGVVGALSLDGDGEAVAVQVEHGHPWRAAEDQRIAPLPEPLVEQPWTLLTIIGLRPVTFVHRGPLPTVLSQPDSQPDGGSPPET